MSDKLNSWPLSENKADSLDPKHGRHGLGEGKNDASRNNVKNSSLSADDFSGEESAAHHHGRHMAEKAQKPVNTRGKKTRALVLAGALTFVAAAGYWAIPQVYSLFAGSSNDWSGNGQGTVLIDIPAGSSGKDIAKILEKNGVVKSASAFVSVLSDNPQANKLQAGAYNLHQHMSSQAALDMLLSKDSRADIKVIIPPGFAIWQVKARLAKNLNISEEKVNSLLEKVKLPSEAGGKLEGWIYPSTYSFYPGKDPLPTLQKMVDKRVSELKELGIPSNKWESSLIMASLAEREVGPKYYPQVVRVIENRLASTVTAGRLELDSTVMYGLSKTKGIPTAAQKNSDTPYNTFKVKGLPPTPIGTPSKQAIEATINPPSGSWLFFCTIDLETGETLFADTFEQHQQNVAKLRAWQAAHPNN